MTQDALASPRSARLELNLLWNQLLIQGQAARVLRMKKLLWILPDLRSMCTQGEPKT